jgi:two-component system CheB/CheR fusion protein
VIEVELASGETPMAQILVADDNVSIARVLTAVLQAEGHTVKTAHDGVEAIDLMSNFRPDWVLLDISMPRADGFEVARFIRAQDWGASVKVVAITGMATKEYQKAAGKDDFDVHLVKPFDLDVVVRLVNEGLRIKRSHEHAARSR